MLSIRISRQRLWNSVTKKLNSEKPSPPRVIWINSTFIYIYIYKLNKKMYKKNLFSLKQQFSIVLFHCWKNESRDITFIDSYSLTLAHRQAEKRIYWWFFVQRGRRHCKVTLGRHANAYPFPFVSFVFSIESQLLFGFVCWRVKLFRHTK